MVLAYCSWRHYTKYVLLLLLFRCRKRQCEHHRRCLTRSSTTFSWPSNSPSNSSSNSSHRQPPPHRCSRPSPRQVFRCNSPRCRCSNRCRCSSRWSASLPSQCSRLWRRQHLCSNRLPLCSYQVSMQAIWFGECLGELVFSILCTFWCLHVCVLDSTVFTSQLLWFNWLFGGLFESIFTMDIDLGIWTVLLDSGDSDDEGLRLLTHVTGTQLNLS